MTEPVTFKYRAFVSYSHADTGWAKWLHGRLEAFPIGQDLVGRVTPAGAIPKTLRPIFRDREDFTAGHSLNEQTLAALDSSAALIVICSPASANSRYVNEEVRLFKARHPERPLIPVIVAGKPESAEEECFAPAVKGKVTPEGEITAVSDEPLAADVREEGDGKNLALAKVVAALIGVSSDEVFRRAERERRRQGRIRSAVGLVMAGLVVGGSLLAWQSHQQRQTIAEVEALVARYNVVDPAGGASGTQGLTDAITAIAQGAAGDARFAKALDLLKAGKPKEAEPLLKAVAEEIEARVLRGSKQAADAYKNLGAIIRLSDPRRARDAYAKAAALAPDDLEAQYWNARLQFVVGNTEAAEQAYRRVLALKQSDGTLDYWWAKVELGNILLNNGDFAAANEAIEEARTAAERLSKVQPEEVQWQLIVAEAEDLIGAAYERQGNFAEALAAFQRAVAIVEELAKNHPDANGVSRSLAMGVLHVADSLRRLGRLTEARPAYLRSVDLMEAFIKASPEKIPEREFLGRALERMGGVLRIEGDLHAAIGYFRKALANAESMVETDPWNDRWLYNLQVSQLNVAEVLLNLGEISQALEVAEESVVAAERRVKVDPTKVEWQRDLARSYSMVAALLKEQGNLLAARDKLGKTIAILEAVAKAAPEELSAQWDLSGSYQFHGDLSLGLGDLDQARHSFANALALRERLAAARPDNESWQHELSTTHASIGKVMKSQGDLAGALDHLRKVSAILERLTAAHRDNAKIQTELAAAYDQTGEVELTQEDADAALASYQAALAVRLTLAEADPDNTDALENVVSARDKVAELLKTQDNGSEACANYRENVTLTRRLLEGDPENVAQRINLAASLFNLATVAEGAEKQAAIKEAIAILDPLDGAGQLTADQATWKDGLLAMRDPSERGWFGLALQDVSAPIMSALQTNGADGALVASVAPDSPAQQSGIEVGDLIVAVDEHLVHDAQDLSQLIAETGAGQTATVKLLRKGAARFVAVTTAGLGPDQASDDTSSLSGEESGDAEVSEAETVAQDAAASEPGPPLGDAVFAEQFQDFFKPTADARSAPR